MRALYTVIGLILGLAAAAAHATQFNFSYSSSDPQISFQGVLTADFVNGDPSYFEITGISGTRNGAAITGLLPIGTTIVDGYPLDNQMSFNTEFSVYEFNFNGMGFLVGEDRFNLYGGLYEATAEYPDGYLVDYLISEVAVPVPASIALLGLGMVGIAAVRRRA